jgi:hypothetical protein
MLDPSGLWIELPDLGVSAALDAPAAIDDEYGSAGGSLVDRKYEFRHRRFSACESYFPQARATIAAILSASWCDPCLGCSLRPL